MQIFVRSRSAAAFIATCALSLPAFARADAALPSARFEPDTVAPGEAAMLRVSTGHADEAPELPAVAGVTIDPVGEQTQVTSRNGVTERSATYLYAVRSDQPGEYVVAGIRVGNTVVSPPTLHVVAGGPSSAPGARNSAARGATSSEPAGDRARMALRLDKQRLYAGESVAFTVKAHFRGGTGVTLKGRPEFSSDAFVVSGLDDTPTQTQTTIDGVPYLAVTWRGALTAVKPGDHPLEVSMPVSLQYREAQPAGAQAPRNRLRDLFGGQSLLDDLFDDPFFQSAFDDPMFDRLLEPGRVVTRDLALRDRAGRAHVLALPEANRPEDFSGAVGRFELQAELPDTELTQGEPAELQFTIRGSGNFGQFSGPGLSDSPEWKAYDPQGTFEPADALGLRGTMRYVQPVAARRGGELTVPGLSFSYFDPDARRYVTETTPAIAVNVAAPARAASSQAPHAAPSQPTAAPPSDEFSARSLARGGVPAWLLPAGLGVLLLAAASAVIVLIRRSPRVERRWRVRRTTQLVRAQRRRLLRAAREGDRIASLRAGRDAVRQRLAAAWGIPPESITAHELEARWPTAPEVLHRVLTLADEAEYAGGRVRLQPELEDLPGWARRVDSQIDHMEVPS